MCAEECGIGYALVWRGISFPHKCVIRFTGWLE